MTRSSVSAVLLTAAALCGCSSESPSSTPASGPGGSVSSENRPPVVRSAWVEPNPVVLTGPITVAAEAHDPDGQAVSLQHEWFVNGKSLPGETGSTLKPQRLSRGDRVMVEVVPFDGKDAGEAFRTKEVRVMNTPPKVKEIRIEPYPPRVGDRLIAHVEAEDFDHDDITYTLRWSRNNDVVSEGEERELDLTGFQRGDQILLEVMVEDDETEGELQRSEPIEIVNSSPEITSTPPKRIQGNKYEYTVTATDRDGDPLVYRLESGPEDMEFDAKTGRMQWFLTPYVKGAFLVRVSVSDGQEGEPVVQEFDLIVGEQTTEES